MVSARIISKTDLARRTRQVVDQVRRGQTVIVESYGREEAALIDILDYRLLKAVTAYQSLPPHPSPVQDGTLAPRGLTNTQVDSLRAEPGSDFQAVWNLVIAAYLDGDISLGRAAELLKLSSFELRERFNRLGIPLHLGPATIAEAQAEFETIRDLK